MIVARGSMILSASVEPVTRFAVEELPAVPALHRTPIRPESAKSRCCLGQVLAHQTSMKVTRHGGMGANDNIDAERM